MSTGPNFVPIWIGISIFVLCSGFAPLINVASKPGFEVIGTINIVRLLAAGSCFGAGVASLAICFVHGRRSN